MFNVKPDRIATTATATINNSAGNMANGIDGVGNENSLIRTVTGDTINGVLDSIGGDTINGVLDSIGGDTINGVLGSIGGFVNSSMS